MPSCELHTNPDYPCLNLSPSHCPSFCYLIHPLLLLNANNFYLTSSSTTRSLGRAMELFYLALFFHQIHNPENLKLLDQTTWHSSSACSQPYPIETSNAMNYSGLPFLLRLTWTLWLITETPMHLLSPSFLNVFWHMYLLHPSTQTPTLDPGNCTTLEKSQAVMKLLQTCNFRCLLIYNVALVSGIEQSDSVAYICI